MLEGFAPFYMDPTAGDHGNIAKVGFDLTAPYGRPTTIENRRAFAPRFATPSGQKRFGSVREALAAGPLFFMELMVALESQDGREIALELEALSEEGVLCRLRDGEWALEGATEKKQR